MNKSYRLIVFDWEGTIGDNLGQITEILIDEAKKLHLTVPAHNIVRENLIFGINIAIARLFRNLTDDVKNNLLQQIQKKFVIKPTKEFLFPGARELINKILAAGMDIAVATNKSQQALQRVLKSTDMEQMFKVTRCAGQVAPKPAPDMLIELMEVFDVNTDDTLMIGDALTDVEMAKAAGVDCLGIDFYHQKDLQKELLHKGALFVFEDYDGISNYLNLPYKRDISE